jgi:hypothetical protein
MRFGLFFLAEYTHMATGAAIFAVMFLGGWHLSPFPGIFEVPGLTAADTGLLAALFKFAVLFGKVVLLIWLMMLIRWTLPRLRFDQVMQVGWQAVIPASMLLVLMNATIVYLGRTSLPEQLIANILLGLAMFATVRLLPKSTKNKRIRLAGSRFSPLDGQLYSCGLVVWQSNGARQGAFHRVRYTGKPVVMPRDLHVHKSDIEITFTDALDPASVRDLQNWSVERWNYQWTEKYGSPEFKLSDPQAKGHDPVDVTAATLSADGRTIRLTLASVVPAMQQRIRYALKSASGQPVESEILHTIHRVPGR